MLALYFPKRFTLPPVTFIYFLSIACPALSSEAAKSMLFTDPNNLSPEPTLADILISNPFKASAIASASSTIFFSLKDRCFKFYAKTFLADTVARLALPPGIKKFLP